MMNRTTLPCVLRSNIPQTTTIISSLSHRSLGSTVIKTALIILALAATPALQAQTCDAIPNPGTESISAHITRKDTNVTVTDGMVIPSWTVLQIDSVATAYGSCTGMAWTNTNPSTCAPDGYFWNRVPNHTQVSVEISSGTEVLGFIVGIV